VVDGSGLENRHTRKGIRGSNPFLSASIFCYQPLAIAVPPLRGEQSEFRFTSFLPSRAQPAPQRPHW
jgi:hypothetical protein